MHPTAVSAIVRMCRRRERQGDCPTEPAPAPEVLEGCILELARQLEAANLAVKIALDPEPEECEAGVLHPEAPR